jgi:Type II CAAX prenyl endopeptidase Rce1-like
MNSNTPMPLGTSTKSRNTYPRLSLVFIALIILQSFLVPLITLASGEDYSKYVTYQYFYVVSSYTIIVLSIIIFGNELEVFRDYFSLGTIIFTCFVRASLGGINESFYHGVLVVLGLILFFYTVINWKSIKVPSLKSVFIGLCWSVGITIILSLIRLGLDPTISILPSNLVSYIFGMLIYHLSFVTVIEEAYFRGILFSLLVANNVKENSAFLVQGILFFGIHYMKIADPILFFVLLPLFTLSVTLIIKKYKMLYLSIMMHTVNNVFGALLVALIRHV